MSLSARKRRSKIQCHLPLFLFVLLLACLSSACGPSPLTSTSASTNQAGIQNACPALAHSIYAVQGQTLYTAISASQHTLKPGETYYNISYRISLIAFNVNNGQKLWSRTLEENVPYSSSFVTDVQVINHTVYIDAGSVVAADASDGHIIWQQKEIGGSAGIRMDVCAGTLSQIDEAGHIIALRASDGTQLWSSTIKHLTIFASFAFTNKGVYLMDRSGTEAVPTSLLTALGPANGKVLWTHMYDQTSYTEVASITTDSQALYVITSSEIITLDPTTGKTLGTLQHQHGPFLGTIRDQTFYLFGPNYDAATILAIDIRNGKQRWENRNPLSTFNQRYGGDNPRYFVAVTSQDLYTDTLLMDKGTDHFCALNSDSGTDRWCINTVAQMCDYREACARSSTRFLS